MLIDKELPVSCSYVRLFFFFFLFNSMVTVHIKLTAPNQTIVLTVSVKKNLTTRFSTHVISIKLSKNLAKDGTLAKSGRFTLPKQKLLFDNISQFWSKKYLAYCEEERIKKIFRTRTTYNPLGNPIKRVTYNVKDKFWLIFISFSIVEFHSEYLKIAPYCSNNFLFIIIIIIIPSA